jgi:hypothetical protein
MPDNPDRRQETDFHHRDTENTENGRKAETAVTQPMRHGLGIAPYKERTDEPAPT